MKETERMESAPPEQATSGAGAFFLPLLSRFRERQQDANTLPISDAGTKEEPWFARPCPCSAGSPAVVCKPSLGGIRRHMHLEDILSACS